MNVVGFSPDGAVVVTGSDDGSVQLWDAARREQLGTPLQAGGSVNAVAVSSRGTVAAATDRGVEMSDGLLLSRSYNAWRDRICGIVHMNLTPVEWRELFGSERYHRTCP